MSDLAERLIREFGERYRVIIEEALSWVAEKEPKWNLERPIDKEQYIRDLMEREGLIK